MKKFLLLITLLVLPYYSLFAAEDIYHFNSSEEQQRFQILTSQLRCLVCQNQNLAESNASLAADLRDQVYEQVQNGKTDKEIINYLVTRYGNFILYSPPLNPVTIGLWVGPFLILIIGLSTLIFYLRKKPRD